MEMHFAAKEASRFTSKPEEQEWSSAKRFAMHLKDNKGVVIEHKFQMMPEKVVAWSDTYVAGCRRTGRHTSGGAAMLGGHCGKTYSQTHDTIALSSGDSE
jgi:hypothetical protein